VIAMMQLLLANNNPCGAHSMHACGVAPQKGKKDPKMCVVQSSESCIKPQLRASIGMFMLICLV
jgi:hypothetical protein